MVETAGRIDGMVSSITSPAVTEPPGLCISQERAGSGCSASRHNNETMLRCAIISGNLRYVSTSFPEWQAVTSTLMGKAGHYSVGAWGQKSRTWLSTRVPSPILNSTPSPTNRSISRTTQTVSGREHTLADSLSLLWTYAKASAKLWNDTMNLFELGVMSWGMSCCGLIPHCTPDIFGTNISMLVMIFVVFNCLGGLDCAPCPWPGRHRVRYRPARRHRLALVGAWAQAYGL
jgi:hypothetical protein